MENMEHLESVEKDENLDTSYLAVLEDKIEKLVDFCLKLQDENRQLSQSLESSLQQVESLTGRLAEYDEMRQDVRDRINRLVRTIEDLESSSIAGTDSDTSETAAGEVSDDTYPSQPELLPSESQGE